MKREIVLTHKFVEFIPEVLEENVLYISIQYATASHKCCCGCGIEVVTPLSPTDWSLFFDGKTVSLEPSIGNWGFPCCSHYWISHNQVHWAGHWSQKKIEAGRKKDALRKKIYFDSKLSPVEAEEKEKSKTRKKGKTGIWQSIKRRLGSKEP